MELCLKTGEKIPYHQRRSCPECKAEYMRRYRKLEQYKAYEYQRWLLIKGSNMELAKREVYKAVRSGRLVPPWTLLCADCGRRGEVYDHRDYFKPLRVEAVCRSCNASRGPGLNR